MSAIISNAQIINEVQIPLTSSSKLLQKSLAYSDGEPLFYNDEDGVCKFYDYDFNLVKSFNLISEADFEYTEYRNFDTCEEAYVAVTQTLFNDDEKFEYFATVENGNYAIVSEDGTILHSFREDEYIYNLFIIKGKSYIITSYYDYENKIYVRTCYLIDKQTTSIQKVAESKGSVIKTAKSSVKVQLHSATSGDGEVAITAMNGQLVKKVQIPAEIKSVEISTEDMQSGIYNFTVSKEGKVLENGKIAIK